MVFRVFGLSLFWVHRDVLYKGNVGIHGDMQGSGTQCFQVFRPFPFFGTPHHKESYKLEFILGLPPFMRTSILYVEDSPSKAIINGFSDPGYDSDSRWLGQSRGRVCP